MPHVKEDKTESNEDKKNTSSVAFFSRACEWLACRILSTGTEKRAGKTSEFFSISEVIDFLNMFNQPFTEKVLR